MLFVFFVILFILNPSIKVFLLFNFTIFPELTSIFSNLIDGGTLKNGLSVFKFSCLTISLNIGNAAFDPVSFLPKVAGSSNPT